MHDTIINGTYDKIAKILKNDQQYPFTVIGKRIISCAAALSDIEQYYEKYPPLLDVIELGASLEYEGSTHQSEIMKQIQYKMAELRTLLPDIR